MTAWAFPVVNRPLRLDGAHPELMHPAIWCDEPGGRFLLLWHTAPVGSYAEAMRRGRVLVEQYRALAAATGGIIFEPVGVVLDSLGVT